METMSIAQELGMSIRDGDQASRSPAISHLPSNVGQERGLSGMPTATTSTGARIQSPLVRPGVSLGAHSQPPADTEGPISVASLRPHGLQHALNGPQPGPYMARPTPGGPLPAGPTILPAQTEGKVAGEPEMLHSSLAGRYSPSTSEPRNSGLMNAGAAVAAVLGPEDADFPGMSGNVFGNSINPRLDQADDMEVDFDKMAASITLPMPSRDSRPLILDDGDPEDCSICGRWQNRCRSCSKLYCSTCNPGLKASVRCSGCSVKDPLAQGPSLALEDSKLADGPGGTDDSAIWRGNHRRVLSSAAPKMHMLQGSHSSLSRTNSAGSATGGETPSGDRDSPCSEDVDEWDGECNEFGSTSQTSHGPHVCSQTEQAELFVRFSSLYESAFSMDLHLLNAITRTMTATGVQGKLAIPLVRAMEHAGRTEDIVSAMAQAEVQQCTEPGLLFRRRSLGFHIARTLLQLQGGQSLRKFLATTMSDVSLLAPRIPPSFELHDGRAVGLAECSPEVLSSICSLCETIFNALHDCRQEFPQCLRATLRNIRKAVEVRFVNDGLLVIGSILIQRLVADSLRSPVRAKLTRAHPDPASARLLSSLANLCVMLQEGSEFKAEDNAQVFNQILSKHRPKLAEMVDMLSSPSSSDAWDFESDHPVELSIRRSDLTHLLRFFVSNMSILGRICGEEERKHPEIQGSFARFQSSVAELTFTAGTYAQQMMSSAADQSSSSAPDTLPYKQKGVPTAESLLRSAAAFSSAGPDTVQTGKALGPPSGYAYGPDGAPISLHQIGNVVGLRLNTSALPSGGRRHPNQIVKAPLTEYQPPTVGIGMIHSLDSSSNSASVPRQNPFRGRFATSNGISDRSKRAADAHFHASAEVVPGSAMGSPGMAVASQYSPPNSNGYQLEESQSALQSMNLGAPEVTSPIASAIARQSSPVDVLRPSESNSSSFFQPQGQPVDGIGAITDDSSVGGDGTDSEAESSHPISMNDAMNSQRPQMPVASEPHLPPPPPRLTLTGLVMPWQSTGALNDTSSNGHIKSSAISSNAYGGGAHLHSLANHLRMNSEPAVHSVSNPWMNSLSDVFNSNSDSFGQNDHGSMSAGHRIDSAGSSGLGQDGINATNSQTLRYLNSKTQMHLAQSKGPVQDPSATTGSRLNGSAGYPAQVPQHGTAAFQNPQAVSSYDASAAVRRMADRFQEYSDDRDFEL